MNDCCSLDHARAVPPAVKDIKHGTLGIPLALRREPTQGDLADPRFAVVWELIKRVDVDYRNGLFSAATGNDVCAVLDALDTVPPAGGPQVAPIRDARHLVVMAGKCGDCGTRLWTYQAPHCGACGSENLIAEEDLHQAPEDSSVACIGAESGRTRVVPSGGDLGALSLQTEGTDLLRRLVDSQDWLSESGHGDMADVLREARAELERLYGITR